MNGGLLLDRNAGSSSLKFEVFATGAESLRSVVAGAVRPWLARLTRYGVPSLKVLAYSEIPLDKSVRVATTVGG